MARTMPRSSAKGASRVRSTAIILGVALAGMTAANTFATPVTLGTEQAMQTRRSLTGVATPIAAAAPAGRRGVTATQAAVAGAGAKVLAAMSAGMVAAVVQAMLSSVTEPIVNRVLVKRMSVQEAMNEITPGMIASFFTTTISTNLIKFPLFEAVAMFVALLPDMSTTVKGLVVGFVFTTSTLPITNFRYRMSIQTPVAEVLKPAVLYQAYLPTVIRDMVYAIARGMLTAAIVAHSVGVSATDPKVLFAVVLGSCVISAPFNEIRGYLLQSSGPKKLTFSEFFKPINFVRSTSLGALNQAIALATGYYLTPIVAKLITALKVSLDGHSFKAFMVVVAALDVMIFLLSRKAAGGVVSDRFLEQMEKMEADAAVKMKQIKTNQEEIKQLKAEQLEMTANEDLGKKISDLQQMVKDLPKEIKGA